MTEIHISAEEIARKFGDVYSSNFSLIFSLVLKKVNSYDEAEDITQEIFIRYLNKISEVNTPRQWLIGAMRFVVLDYYKGRKHTFDNIEDLLDEPALSFVNGMKETRLLLKEALEQSEIFEDEKGKALFELVTIYNYSFTMASRHLEMSYRSVRYRYKKIVKRLMMFLNERGISNMEDLI